MGGKEEAREGGWSKGGREGERGREEGGGRKGEGGREGGGKEGGPMCKHVAGKIVKQYYSIHLSVSISG